MRYISTRGAAPALAFDDVLLAGLARDGGLYVPEDLAAASPTDLTALRGLEYAELAVRVMRPFVGGRIEDDAFARIVRDGLCRLRPSRGGAAEAARRHASG